MYKFFIAALSLGCTMTSHATILNLENILELGLNWEQIYNHIQSTQAPMIVASSPNLETFKNFYEEQLKNTYPFVYQDSTPTNLVILTQTPLDYLQVHTFNQDNYLIEAATSTGPSLIFHGHLPSLSSDQLETLKSYLIATHPYCQLNFLGELNLSTHFDKSPWDLCKGDAGITIEADSKGNKSAQADVNVKSEDDKYQGNIKIEVKEDEHGNKSASGQISARRNF